MQTTEIVVINTTEGGSGFGHRVDNGDPVFVPKSVMRGARIEPLARYNAEIITNQFKADVPWMAIRAVAVADDEPEDSDDTPGLPAFITAGALSKGKPNVEHLRG
jgi:hypothetical protein